MSTGGEWLGAWTGRLTLLCFPHAGARVAQYVRLVRAPFPGAAVVQLPCRPPRLDAPVCHLSEDVVDAVTQAVLRGIRGPLVLWGHSMGAALAFESCRQLEIAGVAVNSLVLSGRDFRPPPQERHLWNDERLLHFLREQGGTPEVVLADKEMRELSLRLLRQDLTLVATQRLQPHPVVHAPLVVAHGRDDTATTVAGVRAWSQAAGAGCRIEAFSGGHFFPWTDPAFLGLLESLVSAEK